MLGYKSHYVGRICSVTSMTLQTEGPLHVMGSFSQIRYVLSKGIGFGSKNTALYAFGML